MPQGRNKRNDGTRRTRHWHRNIAAHDPHGTNRLQQTEGGIALCLVVAGQAAEAADKEHGLVPRLQLCSGHTRGEALGVCGDLWGLQDVHDMHAEQQRGE
jgi:hypothetical protein